MSKFMNCHGHGKEALHLTPIYFYSFWHRSISLCVTHVNNQTTNQRTCVPTLA